MPAGMEQRNKALHWWAYDQLRMIRRWELNADLGLVFKDHWPVRGSENQVHNAQLAYVSTVNQWLMCDKWPNADLMLCSARMAPLSTQVPIPVTKLPLRIITETSNSHSQYSFDTSSKMHECFPSVPECSQTLCAMIVILQRGRHLLLLKKSGRHRGSQDYWPRLPYGLWGY